MKMFPDYAPSTRLKKLEADNARLRAELYSLRAKPGRSNVHANAQPDLVFMTYEEWRAEMDATR